ncbi:FAD-dependent oxidoreductase [uncultured Draconibacterium sp.]|uniref:ferredoxin--NADP reductase n=1 Tax=uncultured Draconibacterium sp. TaxID=1573823 RepID=UPI002AA7C13C|nr:FAD-dependent oxidoreductase [uncultured Draconibacterium sp.]
MAAKSKKEPQLFKQVVTNNEEISPGVHVISFSRNYDFLPGQVVKIGIDNDHPPRIYSICSGNQENEIRILFNIKDDGFLTPKMAAMIPGDVLYVSEPYGSFLGTNEPAWWIATGTGIAPFYAMYRSGLTENKMLIHGVRNLNQFYFEDELEWSMGENYVRCCSQEQSCDVFPGRVTNYLEELTTLPDVKYYLCGKALMVVEVRDMLIEKGVDYGNIIAEIYF